MKSAFLSLFVFALAATPAFAAQEHRELGPHEHGHGILNIAVEKSRVVMELDVPGQDVVGFEHKPESSEQKATAAKAAKSLADALTLFKFPASAGCKVIEAKVSIKAEDAHEEGAAADGSDAPAKAGEDVENHEGHNDYNASYVLDCAKPSEISSIHFGYFTTFAGAKALTVNVVSEKAQNSFEVTREKPVLDLGGTM